MRRAFDHHLAGEEVGVEVDDSHWALDSVKHRSVLYSNSNTDSNERSTS